MKKTIKIFIISLILVSLLTPSAFAARKIPFIKNRGEMLYYTWVTPTRANFVQITRNVEKGLTLGEIYGICNDGYFTEDYDYTMKHRKNKKRFYGNIWFKSTWRDFSKVKKHFKEELAKYKEKEYQSQWDMIYDFMVDAMYRIDLDSNSPDYNDIYEKLRTVYRALDGKATRTEMASYANMGLNKLGVPSYLVWAHEKDDSIWIPGLDDDIDKVTDVANQTSFLFLRYYDDSKKEWMYLDPIDIFTSDETTRCKPKTMDELYKDYKITPGKANNMVVRLLSEKTEMQFLNAHKKSGNYRSFTEE